MLRYMMAVFPGFLTLGVVAALFGMNGGEDYLANIGRIAAVFSFTMPLFAGWVVGRKASPRHLRRDLLFVPVLGYFVSLLMAMIFSVLHQPDWKPDASEIALWLPYSLVAAFLSYLMCHNPEDAPLKS